MTEELNYLSEKLEELEQELLETDGEYATTLLLLEKDIIENILHAVTCYELEL